MPGNLCKDCNVWISHGFSPACKYCENDGKCPMCGEDLRLGDRLDGPMYVCPNGHLFDAEGREFWLRLFSQSPRW